MHLPFFFSDCFELAKARPNLGGKDRGLLRCGMRRRKAGFSGGGKCHMEKGKEGGRNWSKRDGNDQTQPLGWQIFYWPASVEIKNKDLAVQPTACAGSLPCCRAGPSRASSSHLTGPPSIKDATPDPCHAFLLRTISHVHDDFFASP